MATSTGNAFVAAQRAMEEVVVGQVDPAHPVAREQARLVTAFLGLLAARVDHVHAKDRFEVRFAVRQARALLPPAERTSPAIAAELRRAIADGDRLLDDPAAGPGALRALADRAEAVTTALVRTVADADPAVRNEVESTVLDLARDWLVVQRSWFLPQGWEPDDGTLPSLADALAE